jgi:hypothetical protein
LSALLLRVNFLLLLLHSVHVHLAQMLRLVQVLVEGVRWVDRFVLFGRIFASILQDDLGTTWMLGEELGDVVGAAVDNDPARFSVVVLCDLFARKLHRLGIVAAAIHGGNGVTGSDTRSIGQ